MSVKVLSLVDGFPQKLGSFFVEDGEVVYYEDGMKRPMTSKQFEKVWGFLYYTKDGRLISAIEPEEYLDELENRFYGFTWVEVED